MLIVGYDQIFAIITHEILIYRDPILYCPYLILIISGRIIHLSSNVYDLCCAIYLAILLYEMILITYCVARQWP